MLPIMDDSKPKASLIVGISHSRDEENMPEDDKMLEDAASAILSAMDRRDKGLLTYALKTFIKLCDDSYKNNDDEDEENGDFY